jgi:heterodisulfide reductase subunit A-like polyferredoxin
LAPEHLNVILILIVTTIGSGDFSSSNFQVLTILSIEKSFIMVEHVVVHVQGIFLAGLARGPMDQVPSPVYSPSVYGAGTGAHTVLPLTRFMSHVMVGMAPLFQFARGW